jgi:hypothetical protein
VDTPAGVEEFVFDIDDNLRNTGQRTRISRADVATLCVAALSVAAGKKVCFDCISQQVASPEEQPKTAKQALAEFLELSKTTNYAPLL